MRESIGGTWLTGIVIVFLVLFASFLTYSISYTKAFRVKNNIIEIIEENEGYSLANDMDNVMGQSLTDLKNNGTAEADVAYLIKNVGYNYGNNISCEDDSFGTSAMGFCLEKHCTVNSNNVSKVYYKVTTYISLSIPIFDLSIQIPISGETNTLYKDVTGMEPSNTDHKCYKESDS